MLVNESGCRQENLTATMSPKSPDPTFSSYWDWSEARIEEPVSKNALIEMILKSEAIRQMLTCENIGQREATYHRSNTSSPEIKPTRCNSMHDSESYFYCPSYEEEKEVIISRILQEEKQRQVLHTDSIVENLVAESKQEPTTITIGNSGTSYWDW